MREMLLIFIGLLTGAMMLSWALWQMIRYFTTAKQRRRQYRFYFRIAVVVGLIGLADFSKSMTSLWNAFFPAVPAVPENLQKEKSKES